MSSQLQSPTQSQTPAQNRRNNSDNGYNPIRSFNGPHGLMNYMRPNSNNTYQDSPYQPSSGSLMPPPHMTQMTNYSAGYVPEEMNYNVPATQSTQATPIV